MVGLRGGMCVHVFVGRTIRFERNVRLLTHVNNVCWVVSIFRRLGSAWSSVFVPKVTVSCSVAKILHGGRRTLRDVGCGIGQTCVDLKREWYVRCLISDDMLENGSVVQKDWTDRAHFPRFLPGIRDSSVTNSKWLILMHVCPVWAGYVPKHATTRAVWSVRVQIIGMNPHMALDARSEGPYSHGPVIEKQESLTPFALDTVNA